MKHTVRVWDAPTRLFHWALVGCVLGLLVTSQIGGVAMQWHFRFGYSVLTLLLFRLVWGFAGGYWSRFTSFLYSPTAIIRYLGGQGLASQSVGHNPMGALSVFAMLTFLGMQITSGLFSDDEIAAAGPLTRFAASEWVSLATYYHKSIGKFVLLALVALHLCAITFYFFKGHDNLIKSMITGDKILDFAAPSAADSQQQRLLALVIIGVIGTATAVIITWIGG